MGKATMFFASKAITVCVTVSTPVSIRAPAAANPEVNSAAKLKMTTARDSTGPFCSNEKGRGYSGETAFGSHGTAFQA